ncbi:hypothetical protein M0805_007343 [Coniferiporia weirii]|nr:hypothetical protein M0805_007343 [Coniferiporia weirii]
MAPALRCPTCGSKKWSKEARSGAILCGEGHSLTNYRNETTEDADFRQHTMRKRTLKSTKLKKDKVDKASHILYHGERARYHYFQCLQVLLRMQTRKLIELWKLPPEFEVICRDTWALHLSLMPSPPLAEPYLHSQEQGESQRKEYEVQRRGREENGTGPSGSAEDDLEGKTPESDESGSSDSSNGESEGKEDPEMAELLRQASETETTEDESQVKAQPFQEKNIPRMPRKLRRRDNSPAITISVLIHSCWFMRIPVIYKDFIDLVETYELPYLDPLRILPTSLTRHLTKHTKQALSPHHAPTPVFLHAMTSHLSKASFHRCGVFTPELNTAPILWRTVLYMGGNPSLYALSKALARYLELPLALNSAMALPMLGKTSVDPASNKSDNVPPEVALVATVIIALKLIYGLDGGSIRPEESWDPACTMPSFGAYLEHLRAMETSDLDRTAFSPPFTAASQGDECALDAYLEFCERALLYKGKAGDALVAEHFPMQRGMYGDDRISALSTDSSNDGGQAVLPTVPVASVKSSTSTTRPGESYTIYNGQDVLGMLPNEYTEILRRAALWTDVSGDDLNMVVERFERRLVRLWKRGKRSGRRHSGEDEDGQSE